MSNKEKTIVPNRIDLVRKELATISHFENGFVLPEKIPEQGSDNHYHIIGVRLSDIGSDRDKVKRGKHICIPQNQYNKIQRLIKAGTINKLFGGTWHNIHILHDPTIKAKPKALSPKAKSDIKKLKEQGINSKDIADKIGKDLTLVREYFNKLNNEG